MVRSAPEKSAVMRHAVGRQADLDAFGIGCLLAALRRQARAGSADSRAACSARSACIVSLPARSANRGWRRRTNRSKASRSATARTSSASSARNCSPRSFWPALAPYCAPATPPTISSEGQHDVDGLVGRGVHDRRVGGDEDDLEQRGADDDVGRHLEQVDQRRHHDEAAADAHDRGRKPMPAPRPSTGMTLTKSFEARKRIFSGSRWIQLCWPGLLQRRRRRRRARRRMRVDALDQHQPADGAEERDVEQRDEQIELADAAQQREDVDADGRADDAAGQQHRCRA